MSIYDFSVLTHDQKEVPISNFKGKVLLIVNTASACGFTPQYEGLENLYRKFKDQGFEVLAFPCNQFGGQEPGSDEEIQAFCATRFQVSFQVFSKIEVNGAGAHPLFQELKQRAPGILGTEAIKWNFTKFLIDQTGASIQRFAPQDRPDALEKEIEALLNKNS